MGNSVTGNSRERHTLDYYDRLPRSVRAAIQSANLDWACRGWLLQFERGQINAKDLVKRIELADANATERDRVKLWGKDYPKARRRR